MIAEQPMIDSHDLECAPDLRPDEPKQVALLDQAQPSQRRLFAYPAQSNFSGAPVMNAV